MFHMETPALAGTGASDLVDATKLDSTEPKGTSAPPSSGTIDDDDAVIIEPQRRIKIYHGADAVIITADRELWERADPEIAIDVVHLPRLIARLTAIAIEAGVECVPPDEPEPAVTARDRTAAERQRRRRQRKRVTGNNGDGPVTRHGPVTASHNGADRNGVTVLP